jgi:ribosomal protein L20A (L18A)
MPTHLISTQAESEEEFRDIPVDLKSKELEKVEKLDQEAAGRWASKLQVDNTLTRSLVSFQANKGRAVYRWFKYKEAFSADLVEHLLNRALKEAASKAKVPGDLIKIAEIRVALLTAAGISDKALKHLQKPDQHEAIEGLLSSA